MRATAEQREIANDVSFLVDQFKKSEKAQGAARDSMQVACEVTAVKLIAGFLIDVRRIADALDDIARKK